MFTLHSAFWFSPFLEANDWLLPCKWLHTFFFFFSFRMEAVYNGQLVHFGVDMCYISIAAWCRILGGCKILEKENLNSWILTNTLYHGSIMNTLHFSVGPCKMKTVIYLHIYKTVFLDKNISLPLFSSPMVERFVSWWNGCSVDFWQQIDPLCIKIGKITYVHDRYIQTLFI